MSAGGRWFRRLILILCGLAAGRLTFGPIADAVAQPTLEQLEREAISPHPPTSGPSELPPGSNESGYLGLIADDRQERQRGVRVLDILAGGPADQGGLKIGDLIVSLNDKPVANLNAMAEIVAPMRTGETLRFRVDRQGTPRQLSVVLGNRREAMAASAAGKRRLGLRTIPITEELRKSYSLPNTNGALVTEVVVDSPAHRAGVPLDAVIVAANNAPIKQPADLAQYMATLEPGRDIELRYLTRGQIISRTVALDNALANQQPSSTAKPILPPTNVPSTAQQDAPTTGRAADRARIDFLEERVRQLEAQLQAMKAQTPSSEEIPEPAAPK